MQVAEARSRIEEAEAEKFLSSEVVCVLARLHGSAVQCGTCTSGTHHEWLMLKMITCPEALIVALSLSNRAGH